MGQVAVWSPLPYTQYSTITTTALAGYIGLTYDIRTLVSHTRFQSTEIESSLSRQLQRGAAPSYSNIGIDALERLISSRRLGSTSVKDNSIVLEKDFLDLLPGSRRQDKESYLRTAQSMPSIFASADLYYDLVLIDTADSLEAAATMMQARFGLVVLNQDLNMLERYFGGGDYVLPERSMIVVSQYDRYSKYSISNLKRYFNIKQPIAALPYCTGFMDAVNDQDALGWLRRHKHIGKNHEYYPFVESLRKISYTVLEALDVNPDSKEAERGAS
ncbi:ParA family protein [Paenibacillus harenae]|uniref:AAA domain-containing protein n=1 Tax=Paenibacillus harenae TaxID=306543 RepID=A0ABT9TTI2_PAEHA|nr:hypothetical protein [Paenibacillus harenae]MDQ0110657.1 hypothetical protein [Paenibacillus harenae]